MVVKNWLSLPRNQHKHRVKKHKRKVVFVYCLSIMYMCTSAQKKHAAPTVYCFVTNCCIIVS